MNRIQITSKVENGKLKRNRTRIEDAVRSFEGKEVYVTIERKRSKRSNEQNRFYHAVVVELVRQRLLDFGYRYSKDQVHEKLKQWMSVEAPDIMLDETIIPETGLVLSSVRSTTDLSTSEFMDYIATIQQWAAENLDLVIPDPNEQLEIQA